MIAVLGSILNPSADVLNTPDPTPLLSAFLLTLALENKKNYITFEICPFFYINFFYFFFYFVFICDFDFN